MTDMLRERVKPLLEGTDDYTYGGSGAEMETVAGIAMDEFERSEGQVENVHGLKTYIEFLLEPGNLSNPKKVMKLKDTLNKYVLGSPTLELTGEANSELMKAINLYTQDSKVWNPEGDVWIDPHSKLKSYDFLFKEGSFIPIEDFKVTHRGGISGISQETIDILEGKKFKEKSEIMEGVIQSFPEGEMRETIEDSPEVRMQRELEAAQDISK